MQKQEYNVSLYREMRLFFPGVMAASKEEAAEKIREKESCQAELIEDCEGETFAALVDVVGDADFSQSELIDFNTEDMARLRKQNGALRVMLELVLDSDMAQREEDEGRKSETLETIRTLLKNIKEGK